MTEKRFSYNVNKNTIECDGKFVAYVNCVDGVRIANKLNVLQNENEQLKQTVSDWSGSYDELFEDVKRLEKENEQIKQVIKEAIDNERTELGKSVLKQLLETIQ